MSDLPDPDLPDRDLRGAAVPLDAIPVIDFGPFRSGGLA